MNKTKRAVYRKSKNRKEASGRENKRVPWTILGFPCRVVNLHTTTRVLLPPIHLLLPLPLSLRQPLHPLPFLVSSSIATAFIIAAPKSPPSSINTPFVVTAIQETKFSAVSKPHPFPSYSFVCKDRPSPRTGGGGLAFLIHHSVSYPNLSSDAHFPNDSILEHQAINATIHATTYRLYNIYTTLSTSCPPPKISHLLDYQDDHNTVIIGDFNAHNAS